MIVRGVWQAWGKLAELEFRSRALSALASSGITVCICVNVALADEEVGVEPVGTPVQAEVVIPQEVLERSFADRPNKEVIRIVYIPLIAGSISTVHNAEHSRVTKSKEILPVGIRDKNIFMPIVKEGVYP